MACLTGRRPRGRPIIGLYIPDGICGPQDPPGGARSRKKERNGWGDWDLATVEIFHRVSYKVITPIISLLLFSIDNNYAIQQMQPGYVMLHLDLLDIYIDSLAYPKTCIPVYQSVNINCFGVTFFREIY